jgi:ribosomal protein L17
MKTTSKHLRLIKNSTTKNVISFTGFQQMTQSLGVKWQTVEGGFKRISKIKNDNDNGPGAA